MLKPSQHYLKGEKGKNNQYITGLEKNFTWSILNLGNLFITVQAERSK
jgi:hypothetical protein